MVRTWDKRLDLSAVFYNEALSFTERRDGVVGKIRDSGWLAGRDKFDDLVVLVNEHLAVTEDAKAFDTVWDEVYDLANQDRVWIKVR